MLSHKIDEQHTIAGSNALSIACGVVAATSFVWFLYDSVAPAWYRTTTDFPNYYTAARLTVARRPLTSFYDFPSFQREISRTGIGLQLGGYVPQTPLTMLPLIPLSWFDPLNAKRVWTVLNLGFLGLSLWLFSRITRFSVAQLWLVAWLGYGALRQNFHLGQYYVFLLSVLTVAVYYLLRSGERASGTAFATACVLKLYGAPFIVFLAAKRRWSSVATIAAIVSLAILLTAVLFGWHGVAFYTTQILPRSLSGQTLNPYHPSDNTFVTLLRRLFVAEPGLNPAPLVDSPATFASLQVILTLAALLLPVLAAGKRPGPVTQYEFAWWSITLLLISPNTASYTFVLLILPVVLLLNTLSPRDWPKIVVPYVILTFPMRPAWSHLFPKAWLLLFLFVWVGSPYLRSIRSRTYACGGVAILMISSVTLVFTMKHPERPADTAAPIATQRDAAYSSFPVSTASGVFFESIAQEQYAVGHWNGGRFETLALNGHMFHPSAPDSGARVYFELQENGRSSIAFIDLRERRHGIVALDLPDPHEPAVSHDGGTLAFVSHGKLYSFDGRSRREFKTPALAHDPAFVPGDRDLVYVAGEQGHSQIIQIDLDRGENTVLLNREAELASPSVSFDHGMLVFASRQSSGWQVWTEDLVRHRAVQATSGRCNSWAPAWAFGTREIIFASDCKRGLNLPALFRMPFDERAAIH
jgi:hypothetical protein